VLGVLFVYLMFTNETIKGQVFDMQAKGFEQAIESGRMTQQQADQIRNQMDETGLGMWMAFGSIPVLIFTALFFFVGALFLWLASKFVLKSTLKYGKYLEVYGLATWIGILGSLVYMGMVFGMNSLWSTPSLGLVFMDSYDPFNTLHKFASAVNVFSVWQAIVTGIGLSKLADKPSGIGIGVAVGLWVVWVAIGVPLGLIR
ncbi:MAG TPA: hypothetical protein VGA55_00090, partial [Bacteroidota bacterium]